MEIGRPNHESIQKDTQRKNYGKLLHEDESSRRQRRERRRHDDTTAAYEQSGMGYRVFDRIIIRTTSVFLAHAGDNMKVVVLP